jgi:hypothetical protein
MVKYVAALGSLVLVAAAIAQEKGGTLKSGPQPGTLLHSSFHPYNVNGPIGAGRYHCLVCEFKLNPVVMVFAREAEKGKDKALNTLIDRLEEAVAKDQEGYLKSFVVFLSPGARSSATEPKITDPNKLVDEASQHAALLERLRTRAKTLKHVILTCYPEEGPKGYNISPQAAVTVVLYVKHRVVNNFAFPEGGLDERAIDEIMKAVNALSGKTPHKKGPPKKEAGPEEERKGVSAS